jgi:hypothetical protein
MPEKLPQVALDAISYNRTSGFLAGSYTQASRLEIIYTPDNKKTFYRCFMLCGSKLKKFCSLPQANDFWKCGRDANNHARS